MIARAVRVTGFVALAACTPPPLTIAIEVQSGPHDTCTSQTIADPTCADVPLACPSMLLVRVLDPNNPGAPFISSCQSVVLDHDHDLCSIVSSEIPADRIPKSLPERTLAVQVVVLPLTTGSDGLPDCDAWIGDLNFADGTGLLQSEVSSPPIGGQAYYHPGDAVTVVALGCPDLETLNAASCTGSAATSVVASVDELDTQIGVSTDTASHLAVSIGAPITNGSDYTLDLTTADKLDPNTTTPPAWSAAVAPFTSAACLAVLEDTAMATATLTCTTQAAGESSVMLTGQHVSTAQLAQITLAIQATDPAFTLDRGLVLGLVLDDLNNPLPGATVAPLVPGATVHYLSDDGTTLTSTSTSSNGIFLSTDAPFSTTWTSLTSQGFGGLVDGKVTVVVLATSQTHT